MKLSAFRRGSERRFRRDAGDRRAQRGAGGGWWTSATTLTSNGMSSGTCPGGVCGIVTVMGDTTGSLTYDVKLSPGVSFHGAPNKLADFFYFDVTGGTTRTITGDSLTGGSGYTYNGIVSGSFVPNPGNFPGTYNYAGTCTAGNGSGDPGSLCGDELKFTVNGGSMADPLVIGAPLGHGLFATDNIAFVADLSISGSCGDVTCTAGTGLVGSGPGTSVLIPETVDLGDDAHRLRRACLCGLAQGEGRARSIGRLTLPLRKEYERPPSGGLFCVGAASPLT